MTGSHPDGDCGDASIESLKLRIKALEEALALVLKTLVTIIKAHEPEGYTTYFNTVLTSALKKLKEKK